MTNARPTASVPQSKGGGPIMRPLTLRHMIRSAAVDVGVTDKARVRHFASPFQKKLHLKPNPRAADLIKLVARGQTGFCLEVGAGLGLQRALAGQHPLLEGLDILTVEYPYLLPALQRSAPNEKFEPLSHEWQNCFLSTRGQHRVIHLSGILERVPDPGDLLLAVGKLVEPSSAVVVSLRPIGAALQALPDDCYQQWTEEEFKHFVASAGFRVIAQALSKDWSCFLLGSSQFALAPWVQLLGVSARASSLAITVNDTPGSGVNDLPSAQMTLSLGADEYRLHVGVNGIPQIVSAPSDKLPSSKSHLEINDLESLDHLNNHRNSAIQAYPREVRKAASKHALEKIHDSVLKRKPLSVVRVSHAEIRALAYPAQYPPVWLNRSLKVCFGKEIDVGDYGTFLSDLDAAVRACDVVGVPDPGSKDLQHATNAILLDAEGITAGKPKFFGDLHFSLLDSGLLDRLIAESASVSLITSRDILQGFRRKYDRADTRLIQIPGEARWMAGGSRRHVPDAYNEIVRDLRVRETGELFLVGAGLAAKKYCQVVRDQGGIAIDIGSVFDLWGGAATRTGFEERTKLLSLAG